MPNTENDECLICKSKNIKKYPAKFAQFIADRVFNGYNKNFSLIHCKKCGFAYFDYRFSDDETSKLYKNYRDPEYQELRQSSESWYTKDINHLIGNNDVELTSRKTHLSSLLLNYENFNIDKINDILDFGGDLGQFIPDIFNKCNKYVYDISGKNVLDGIIPLRTKEECNQKKYDFIICAHVLEHVANPDELIKYMKNLLSDKAFLYIELPYDSPFYKNFTDNLQFLFNPYFKFKDILKHFFKRFGKKYAFMHEHINYFSKNSAEQLLLNNDFKIITSEISDIKSVVGNYKVISIIAKL